MKINKLKIALSDRSSEQGFALPIAIGLGLVMLLVGTTMIVRSQSDQVTASVQKGTSESFTVAETGVTRVQSFLNQYRGFATQPYSERDLTKDSYQPFWTYYLATLVNPCASGTVYEQAVDFDDWVTVGSGSDQFIVVNYTISTPTEATLVVEGQARQGDEVKSTTRLQVKVPFDRTRMPSFEPPAAWAQNFVLNQNSSITGNVIDTGCAPGSLDAIELARIPGGNVVTDPSLNLPLPLPVPAGAIPLGTINANLILPQSGDIPNANNEYVYRVDSINLTGTNKLVITPGKKVYLYLDGNINTDNSGVKIEHNCTDSNDPNGDGKVDDKDQIAGCLPTNFKIFGGINTTEIEFFGNNTIDAFIFAPNVNTVAGNAQIRGAMWLKEWNNKASPTANALKIQQQADWKDIPPSLWPPRLAPLSSWERQETP